MKYGPTLAVAVEIAASCACAACASSAGCRCLNAARSRVAARRFGACTRRRGSAALRPAVLLRGNRLRFEGLADGGAAFEVPPSDISLDTLCSSLTGTAGAARIECTIGRARSATVPVVAAGHRIVSSRLQKNPAPLPARCRRRARRRMRSRLRVHAPRSRRRSSSPRPTPQHRPRPDCTSASFGRARRRGMPRARGAGPLSARCRYPPPPRCRCSTSCCPAL